MKTNKISVRLDSEQSALLESERKRLNLRGHSGVVRLALEELAHSDQPQLKREMAEEFQAWRKELHGVGTNLNQIAFRLNAGHPLSSHQIEDVLGDLQRMLKRLSIKVKEARREFRV
ncbi:plasmid mobilization relaxosome protein MobC [Pseudodesulfovibrio indicus]|uniref:Mobilization protein MobC n=1 Tax=Pseudodesulfovibrio indicus TaxID=1716143 RepID=A0A126QPP9_9BACT|nr:plasmid mobilization relaxosome protein MobC [Pseudodesulfovibrio indicus]AMK12033.1 hypothetical protein AWY79_13420 [Pseudodesulfovibrio indicus]TDT88633.1 mobilization protein MobC [Pseudodesulfovibrio indicus]